MPKKLVVRERCPLCKKFDHVGDCGHGRFFCNKCFVEFKLTKKMVSVYGIDGEGDTFIIFEYAR